MLEPFSDPRHTDGSTTWHHQLVAGIVASYVDCVYIEIGIYQAGCWNVAAPLAKIAHGVDNDIGCASFMNEIEGSKFWPVRSDDFFLDYSGPPADVIFVDGCHDDPYPLRDTGNALDLLSSHGTIILHDTQPTIWAEGERPDRPDLEGNLPAPGEGYLAREFLENEPGIECFTFQRFPGITIARLI